ncbi:MAG: hypothetical protein KAI47_07535, partial [Deltaproteobacteria bacterium]|nr:hypothetical protein [Deltaproteobacteria bacterium]
MATGSLSEVLGFLARARERLPGERELILLSGEAMMRAGKFNRAAKLLDHLPGNTARVVRAKAKLQWYRGQERAARALLQRA